MTGKGLVGNALADVAFKKENSSSSKTAVWSIGVRLYCGLSRLMVRLEGVEIFFKFKSIFILKDSFKSIKFCWL